MDGVGRAAEVNPNSADLLRRPMSGGWVVNVAFGPQCKYPAHGRNRTPVPGTRKDAKILVGCGRRLKSPCDFLVIGVCS
jgi:hypothetical protein